MSVCFADLSRSRLVPVVTVRALDEAEQIANALADGGVSCVEITMRTEHALEAIHRIAVRGNIRVGAGTVLDPASVDAAVDAGASFIVSPGFDEEVVDAARSRGAAVLPGIATASELQRARRIGLRHVKVFPIAASGGLDFLESLHHPFPDMAFMPSGGVASRTAREYLAHPAVFAVGVSWLVPPTPTADLYGEVRTRTEEALAALATGRDRG